MGWGASQRNDDRDNDQANHHTNLDARQPKFKLAENSYTEVVDEHDKSQENGDPNSGVDSVSVDPVSITLES